jgi:hypothetical protein
MVATPVVIDVSPRIALKNGRHWLDRSMEHTVMHVRKTSVRLLAVVILLSLLAPASVQSVLGQPEATAMLTPLQGLVQRRADSDPEYMWQTVTRVQLISEGDWVQTDSLGMAEVTFFDGNLMEILPNSLIQVGEYQFADDDSPVLTIEQSVGDMRHQIDRILDSESRYEVHTPSAIVAVRGTNFFSSVTWQGETIFNLDTGMLAVSGISPDGVVGPSLIMFESQSLPIAPDGQPGTPGPYDPPAYPPPAPLAPETCGDAICDPDEKSVCALDCQTSATCGNGICEAAALEGPVTCRVDCVPTVRPGQSPSGTTEPSTLPEVTGRPCTVWTARGDVTVRAGPGFQRGVRSYLVSNVNVPVVGKFTDSDGHLWWKIQPPGFNPAEADRYWVLADDVDEVGDCALVADAAASPIVAPQPTQPGVPTLVPTIPPSRPTETPPPTRVPTEPALPTRVPTEPALPTRVPTKIPILVSFYADRYTINPRQKECATVYWEVTGSKEVYYEGNAVAGRGSVVECPMQTTTYTLTVGLVDGSTISRYVTITVEFPG